MVIWQEQQQQNLFIFWLENVIIMYWQHFIRNGFLLKEKK